LFNENNLAAMTMISLAIRKVKDAGSKIGLCGQAPSDFPAFAKFLVEEGINSISFNPDALLKGIENINEAEDGIRKDRRRGVVLRRSVEVKN
ncbi:MAG TPA: putative PEP-binding protein, partial [Bacteroidia bacterium]